MLRFLIGTGVILMLAGFGAAGWQYWQGLPQDVAASGTEALPSENAGQPQSWLISPSGGMVRREDVRAFLEQDKFVQDRMVAVTEVAELAALLADGEKLPDVPYLEVLADIRAPMIAQDLCPAVTATVARVCVVHSARVVKGSVDAISGTAVFRIELAYRQSPSDLPLPDLASHVLRTETVAPFPAGDVSKAEDSAEPADPASDEAAVPPASAEAALSQVLQAVSTACSDEDRAPTCRLLGLSLDWAPGIMPQATARVAWLAPLPEGMTAAPPLEPLPEG
ncbi:MAG: hypothetical protein NTW20_17585 [Rhodobacterales bacterium]|nr:hypothetical protein [Rhodobacterales bacterium]